MLINFFAVLVAAIAAMVIGSLWYSPFLFGKAWMRMRGLDPRSMESMSFPLNLMALEFVCALVAAYVLGIFSLLFGAHTVFAAVFLAFLIWIGFYVTQQLSEVLWEERPFGLFLINASQRLVSLLLMALIVGLWR